MIKEAVQMSLVQLRKKVPLLKMKKVLQTLPHKKERRLVTSKETQSVKEWLIEARRRKLVLWNKNYQAADDDPKA